MRHNVTNMHVITSWYKLFEVKKQTRGAANRNSNQLAFFTGQMLFLTPNQQCTEDRNRTEKELVN